MGKSRILFLATIAFVGGVALSSFVFIHPLVVLILGMVAVFFTLVMRRGYFALYGILILTAAVGMYRVQFSGAQEYGLQNTYGDSKTLRGFIVANPERSGSYQRFIVRIIPEGELEKFKVLVTTRTYPKYRIGDELLLRGDLKETENYSDFDYKAYLAKDGVFAVMPFPEIEHISEGKGNFLLLFLAKVKYGFEKNIDAMLPEPHAAFLKGILLGNREDIPREVKDAFSATGTTHIVALSGYNITILGRFLIGGLVLATVPFRLSFWIASTAIALFVLMTGASPSVVRAGIMGLLVLVATREGRIYNIRNAIALAAGLMIFQNPLILRFDAAFQLSFLATLGIVYLAPVFEKYVFPDSVFAKKSFWRDVINFMKKTFVESLAAQCAVLPLLIFLFGQVSLISPLVNVLVIIAVPYAMAAGFFATMAGFFSETLSRALAFPAWALLEYKLEVIEFFSKMPLASVALDKFWILPVLILYAVAGWAVYKKSSRMLRPLHNTSLDVVAEEK